MMRETTTDTEEPTIGSLVHDLSEEIPELIRAEIRLAQAEITQKGKQVGLGIGMFSAAGLLACFGLATLVATAVLALDLAVPAWAAALITAAALFVIAAAVAAFGRHEVQEGTPVTPERAIEGIKEDVNTVKGARS